MTKYVSVCTDPLIIHPIIPSIKYVLWDINIELTGNMTKYVTVCTDPLMSPVAQLENLILHCVIKLCISDMYHVYTTRPIVPMDASFTIFKATLYSQMHVHLFVRKQNPSTA